MADAVMSIASAVAIWTITRVLRNCRQATPSVATNPARSAVSARVPADSAGGKAQMATAMNASTAMVANVR
jgi:hypothetical protein